METTRRTFLAGIAAASVPSGAAAMMAMPNEPTAQERFAFHLEEMKKAYAEMDPAADDWRVARADDPEAGCSLVITCFRRVGRYEGDGVYFKARSKLIRYRVRQREQRLDGYRTFHVTRKGERPMILTEPALNSFLGKRVA
jgi:hypothetical protein